METDMDFDRINMDIDDIEIQNHNGEHSEPEDAPPPSNIILNHLLRRSCSSIGTQGSIRLDSCIQLDPFGQTARRVPLLCDGAAGRCRPVPGGLAIH